MYKSDLLLPIDSVLPQIVQLLDQHQNLVLVAPPGSGKTTRVPATLLNLPRYRQILVLEPRRIAAKLAAQYLATQRQERLGEVVGYQVRLEEMTSPQTRLRFITEGILTRRLLSDARLKDIDLVILDEFHERHLTADIALALTRQLQKTTRPDLQIIVMSATLEAQPVAQFLGDCPIFSVDTPSYPVTTDYLTSTINSSLPSSLEQQVATAVGQILTQEAQGDILVFLPGAAEIRRAQQACARFESQLLILTLHGEMPLAAQTQVLSSSPRRKLILATNVAESSITIEGVKVVIDSGLARIASYSPWSGLPSIKIERISQASAQQRTGRAGRTSPGRCLRLYSRLDYDSRPSYTPAEIHRTDLSETVLELAALGNPDLAQFPWFEAPPATALTSAQALLQRLGALDTQGITPLGRQMQHLSTHPRLARVVLEAATRGAGAEGCLLAALIGERDIRLANRDINQRSTTSVSEGPSDLLTLWDMFSEAEHLKFHRERLATLGLDTGAVIAVDRTRQQLIKQLKPAPTTTKNLDQTLMIALLAGYPDRVARRRPHNREVVLATGGTATLSERSVVRSGDLLVAIDIEQRQTTLQSPQTYNIVRLASRIEADWLLELCLEQIEEQRQVIWQAETQRVITVERLVYYQLVIEESLSKQLATKEMAQVLAEKAEQVGLANPTEQEDLARWQARLAFVAQHCPELKLPTITEAEIYHALEDICLGLSSLGEVRNALAAGALLTALKARLTSEQQQKLQRLAPERATLPNGRSVKIEYELGQRPWLASRLQDFFGMKTGPTIAEGRQAVVLQLLAPNRRAVQITTDLASFWQSAYPQLRKELSRRYPKHAWPEDPRQALPPAKPRT